MSMPVSFQHQSVTLSMRKQTESNNKNESSSETWPTSIEIAFHFFYVFNLLLKTCHPLQYKYRKPFHAITLANAISNMIEG